MIKRIIITSYVIVGLVLFKFAFTYGYNEWVKSKYEKGDYTENYNLLEVANFNEPYIVYYNNGNVSYQRQDYEVAIEYFETALTKNPPEEKECLIRINLVLSKLALLGEDAFANYTNHPTSFTINLPNSVTAIGKQAFKDCEMKRIKIPKSVNYIANDAFSNCETLEDITLEKGSSLAVPANKWGAYNAIINYEE